VRNISNSISDFIKRNFLALMNPKTHHIQWKYFYSCYPNMFVFWWPLLRRISPSLQACPFFCYSRTFVPVNTTESWVWWNFHTSAQLFFGVPTYFIVLCTKCIISNDLTGRSCLSVHVSFPSKFNECQSQVVMNVCSKGSGGDATEHRQKYLNRTETTNQEDGDNYTRSNFVIYYHGNTLKLREVSMKRNLTRWEMRAKYLPANWKKKPQTQRKWQHSNGSYANKVRGCELESTGLG
jgi:hypothetical protein